MIGTFATHMTNVAFKPNIYTFSTQTFLLVIFTKKTVVKIALHIEEIFVYHLLVIVGQNHSETNIYYQLFLKKELSSIYTVKEATRNKHNSLKTYTHRAAVIVRNYILSFFATLENFRNVASLQETISMCMVSQISLIF